MRKLLLVLLMLAPVADAADVDPSNAVRVPIPSLSRDRIAAVADNMVQNFRRMIVLHEAAGRSRDLTQAGQYLFFRNRELAAQFVADLVAPPPADSDRRIDALLDLLESR